MELARFERRRRKAGLTQLGRRKATRKETLMSEKKAPGKLAHAKGTQKYAKIATKQPR